MDYCANCLVSFPELMMEFLQGGYESIHRGHNSFVRSTGGVVGGDFVMALNSVPGGPFCCCLNGRSVLSTIPQ
jgi:hypothetical protein